MCLFTILTSFIPLRSVDTLITLNKLYKIYQNISLFCLFKTFKIGETMVYIVTNGSICSIGGCGHNIHIQSL